jgi:hypothetical protein
VRSCTEAGRRGEDVDPRAGAAAQCAFWSWLPEMISHRVADIAATAR